MRVTLSVKNLEKELYNVSRIRHWFGFLAVTNFIYKIPHMAGVIRVVRK